MGLREVSLCKQRLLNQLDSEGGQVGLTENTVLAESSEESSSFLSQEVLDPTSAC